MPLVGVKVKIIHTQLVALPLEGSQVPSDSAQPYCGGEQLETTVCPVWRGRIDGWCPAEEGKVWSDVADILSPPLSGTCHPAPAGTPHSFRMAPETEH